MDGSTPLTLLLGIGASIFLIWAALSIERPKILALSIIVSTLAGLQYAAMGETTGMILCAVSGIRTLTFLIGVKVKALNHWSVLVAFVMLSIALSLLFMNWPEFTWLQIIPIIGTVVGSVGMFMQNVKHLKTFNLIAAGLWIIYEFGTQSYGQLPGEVFNAIGQAWALYVIISAEREGREPVSPITQVHDAITSSIPVITRTLKTIPTNTSTTPIPVIRS